MTRINPLPPRLLDVLNNRHLGAIAKEYPRIFTAVEKLIAKGMTPSDVDIPDEFTFNEGHCKFFYNKLKFIYNACIQTNEIAIYGRGLNYNYDSIHDLAKRYRTINDVNPDWCNDWEPTRRDVYLGMARLVSREFKTKMQVVGRKIVE